MRRRRTNAMGSLDSLLDTMTNVVGILVILLVVTQLGVREAVDRISETEAVDPAELAAAVAKAETLAAERAELELQLASLQSDDPAAQVREQARIEQLIAHQRAVNRDVREVLESEMAARKKKIEEQAAATRDVWEKFAKEIADLEKQFTENSESIASLKARLASTPAVKPPPAKVVHLPNPRPAPEGALPLTFMCRDGKIYFVNIDAHQNRAVRWTDSEIARRKLGADPKKGIDCGPLFASFNRQSYRDRDVQLKLETQGRLPYLVFQRREHGGETLEEIREPRAYFQRGLKQIKPDQYYLQFLVWNDSFELYLEARRMASDLGFLAGWQPMTTTGEYKVRLASKLRHGPPPPPKPQPPKPNPPKPQPPPRPVPTDVID